MPLISKKNLRVTFSELQNVDKPFLLTTLLILLFGLLMVYDASVFYASQNFNFKFHFLILQAGWVIVGLSFAVIVACLDLNFFKENANLFFLCIIGILIFILFPTPFAPEIYGARRWFYINPSPFPRLPFLGTVGFQPSELAKLVGIIFGSAFFSSVKFQKDNLSKTTRNFIFIVVIIAGLVAIEPDFTTAFITGVILMSVAYYANSPIRTLLTYTIPVFVLASLYAVSSTYRMERIMTLFRPEDVDSLGAGYHIRQIMIALGSGGLWGVGFGNSRQKYAYLPEVIGDSIFAIIGEEFGFLGSIVLITLFALFIWRCFYIAEKSKTKFGELIAKGVGTWFAIQVIINLLSMVRLMPLTGVPLPLISYGGSSTIFMLIGIGLVVNVSKDLKKN